MSCPFLFLYSFFFFNDTAPSGIYTLSLHDALPISGVVVGRVGRIGRFQRLGDLLDHEDGLVDAEPGVRVPGDAAGLGIDQRSEEHTSELQSLTNLVCRLLLEKKKNKAKKRMEVHRK